MRQLATNSRLRVYQTCQRLEYYQYQLGYRPIERSRPLEFGTLGHEAEQEWWKCHKDGHADKALDSALEVIRAADVDEFEQARLIVLMTAYDLRWAPAMRDIEVLFVEQEFRFAARDFDFGGKIDVGIRYRKWANTPFAGKEGVGEHKFTSADLSPASDYWRGLRLEPQVSHYFRGMRSMGFNPEFCLWDAIRRPEIKALQATPEEDRIICTRGPRKGLLRKNQRENDETPEEHGARLAQMIAESPDDWFARQIVVRLPHELQAFEDDTMALAEDMIRPDRHAPRNPDACRKFGRPCAFMRVCDGDGSLDDTSLFQKSENIHPELQEVA
jgi:hypothetical protein